MGKLTYGADIAIDFEDRFLAHLQIVIGLKLARGESFYFSWRDDQKTGGGRTSIWLQPGICLVFKYYGSRIPAINPQWLAALTRTANTHAGLHEVEEPFSGAPEQSARAEVKNGATHL